MGDQNQPSSKKNEKEKQRLYELLQRGISDARLKNKESARTALREVVKIDPQSEKGWFWLASVAENDAERLEALQNVVLLNPDNQRAFQILEKLEQVRAEKIKQGVFNSPPSKDATEGDGEESDESSVATGGDGLSDLSEDEAAKQTGFTIGNLDSEKSRLVLIGGGVTVFAFLCIIFLVVSGGGSDNKDGDSSDNNTNVADVATATDIPPTDTPAPTIDPNLPTETPFLTATPPPTPLPTATITSTPEPISYPAPPNEVTGKLLISAGAQNDYQPVILFNLFDDTSTNISGTQRGKYPSFSGDASRYVYMEYSATNRRTFAMLVDARNPENKEFLDERWNRQLGVFEIDMPAWSPSDTMIAFVANALTGGEGKNLFIFDFNAAADAVTPFIEVESPETYGEPAWSPDSSRIVSVADTQGNFDLRSYEIGTGGIANLTNDGNALIESSPDWSADNRIVFSGKAQNSEGSDIYIMPADGSGAPTLLIDLGPNDITPRWSPDSNYVAFSSDANGAYNVYVYDFANDTFYAVTNERFLDSFLSDWVR